MARTRFLYLAVLVFAALAALSFGSYLAFMALYAALLMPVVSAFSLLIYPAASNVFFRVSRRRIFRGESQRVTMKVKNGGIFSYPTVELNMRDELAVYSGEMSEEPGALPSRGLFEREYDLLFPYRGVYKVGLKSAVVTDFLGLFRHKFACNEFDSVTVLPKLVSDFSIPIGQRQMNEGEHGIDRFSDDWAEVSDVRRHDPSDDYRKIHWKLSAKRGEFIVKNFRTPGLNRTLVFIETRLLTFGDAAKHKYEDTMVSYAASAVDFCLKNRQACRLIYGEQENDGLELESHKDMEKALLLLALLPFKGAGGGLLRAIHRALLSHKGFVDMVVFASRVDIEVCAMLKTAFSAGHNVFLYYVCPPAGELSASDYSILDEVEKHGITVEILK